MDTIRFLNIRYFFEQVYNILTGTGSGGFSIVDRFLNWWFGILPTLKIVSTYLSLIFLTLAIYSYVRYKQVQAEEKKKFANYYEPGEEDGPKNERWQKILALIETENPNDWKQAIIDADIILDEIVTAQGYGGVTLGEKMKSIEPSDFTTLDSAWNAHKVRNRIAHDGGDFVLTQREAKRVINLFAAVFREFQYI
jgi:hypothetical protein